MFFADAPATPETFNLLLFGPPGSGKTVAGATLAPLGPVLWVNAEQPNALAYARKVAGAKNLLEVRVDRGTPNVKNVLDEVVDYVREGHDPKPATVVIDTLGKVRDALIKQLVVPGAKNSIQQFGQVADALKHFVARLMALPVNVVLLAHEVIEDVDGDRVVRPLIGGVLTSVIPGEVDVMAYTRRLRAEDGTERYVGVLTDVAGRQTKDRSGALAKDGPQRDLDLAAWLADFRIALGADGSDLPWTPEPDEQGTLP